MPAVRVLVNAAQVESFAAADPYTHLFLDDIGSAWDGAGLDYELGFG